MNMHIDYRPNNPSHDGGSSTGSCNSVITVFKMAWIFIKNKLSIEKAVNDYAANYARNYHCPYTGKCGSCSQLLLDHGLVALAKKCHELRTAAD